MATTLPHFGEVADFFRQHLLQTCGSPEVARVQKPVSNGTLKSISSGCAVKESTWDGYASELVDALLKAQIFPLHAADRAHLVECFHAYRSSYEQLNELVSRISCDSKTIVRAVLRLQFLSLGIRYAAVCLLTNTEPCPGVPLWAQKNGANKYWRALVRRKLPKLPFVGGKDRDCADAAAMSEAKMRDCLYDNAYPGADAFLRILPDPSERSRALRHYFAYRGYIKLAGHVGEGEVTSWVRSMTRVSAILAPLIRRFLDGVPESERCHMLTNIMTRGVWAPGIREFVNESKDEIPEQYRDDLLAIIANDPRPALLQYVEFCTELGEEPREGCWEESFLNYMAEFREFQSKGRFPDGSGVGMKPQLIRLLMRAGKARAFEAMEQILVKIIAHDPQDARARHAYGQLLEGKEKFEEAWAEYTSASTIDDSWQQPLFDLAESKSWAGQHEDALRVVDKIASKGIGPGSRSFLKATCLIRSGNFVEVVPLLVDAHENGYEPGTCACVLSWVYGRLAPQSQDAAKQQRRWRKIARHHGLSVEVEVRKLKFC